MTRAILLTVLGFAAAVASGAAVSTPDASAVPQSSLIGAYRLKLKGDGWWRGTSSPYRVGRISGGAVLVFTKSDPDDGMIHAAIQLDSKLTETLVDLATPDPAAFVGSGYVVGDSLTMLDTGSTIDRAGTTYLNAMTILFLKDGAKLTGHWLTSFPAASPDAGPASAIGVDFTGKRLPRFKSRGDLQR
jgi:hypothetical protein